MEIIAAHEADIKASAGCAVFRTRIHTDVKSVKRRRRRSLDNALAFARSSSRPHRIVDIKEKLAATKSDYQHWRNMIAAVSKGDMLEGPVHLATNQLKARSMEPTSKARPSNGKTSPANIETQLGAAFDQSMPSTGHGAPSELPSQIGIVAWADVSKRWDRIIDF